MQHAPAFVSITLIYTKHTTYRQTTARNGVKTGNVSTRLNEYKQQEQEQEHILYWFEHRFLTKWLHSIRCGEKYNNYIRGCSAHMDISQNLNNTNTSLLVGTYYEFC
jgi:hypothetical protein